MVDIGALASYTNSSGDAQALAILPTVNQSGTAGGTDLLINRTETAVGSGSQYLIDAQVDGVSKFSVTNGGGVEGAAFSFNNLTVNPLITATSQRLFLYSNFDSNDGIKLDGVSNTLHLPANHQLVWNPTDSPNSSAHDTGLARDSAGVVKVTDGGAGAGDLIVQDLTVLGTQTGGGGGGGGGGGMTALVKGEDYTASADEQVLVTSDTGTWTITLPASPTTGDKVSVWDCGDNAGSNVITVARNGSTINGAAEDFLLNMDGGRWDGVYDGTTWEYSFVIQTVQPSQTVSDYRYLHRLADGGLSPAGGAFVTHNGVDCISFTPSAQCWCMGVAHVPEDWDGSGIEVRFWGHMSGTSTGAMQWGTATIPTADGDLTTASDAYSGLSDQTPGGVANAMHYTSWMSWNMADLPGITAGDGFRFKFYRNGNTDANTDTFYLHAVEFRFPVDKTLKALTAISNTASLVPNVQSGTAYTIQATDNGKTIVCTNAAAVSVTLPDGLDQNFQCTVVQYGAGAVTVTPGGSDTVNGSSVRCPVSGQG
jgi:hypothetical protein